VRTPGRGRALRLVRDSMKPMSPELAGAQSRADLEAFDDSEDRWNNHRNPAEAARVARLLAALSAGGPGRTLDIGCGNGFVTNRLPGREIVGVDLSRRASAAPSPSSRARRATATPGSLASSLRTTT
jgi:SAM-dependent methyltransferase